MSTLKPIWAIVPAAGVGARMQSEVPKQYLSILGKTVLEHTLDKLDQVGQIKGIIVAIAKNDTYFDQLRHIPKKVTVIEGGNERSHSVSNALSELMSRGLENDWALVHDAARPCVQPGNIERLIQQVFKQGEGGILACPAADTLKHVSDKRIQKTVDRSTLWHAHTPQLFVIKQLFEAISQASQNNKKLTDEASAIESLGIRPIVVHDTRDNIKITQPEDLLLAEFILKSQNHM